MARPLDHNTPCCNASVRMPTGTLAAGMTFERDCHGTKCKKVYRVTLVDAPYASERLGRPMLRCEFERIADKAEAS